jgi:undecaprenyl-diphosphatase
MHQLDISLFHFVNAWSGNWTLDRVVHFEERHDFYKGGLFMIAYWWFWFAPSLERRAVNRRTIIAAIIGSLLALIVNRAIATGLPFRIRPMLEVGSGYRPPSLPITGNMEDWSAFPSDTATFFFALAFGMFRLSRPLSLALIAYSAIWICLPRLYLGLHYPSDMIFGGILGVVTVWFCMLALDARNGALGRRIMAVLDAAEKQHPQLFYAIAIAVSFEMMILFDDVRDLVRSAVRFLRFSGYLVMNESAALFLVGGAVFAVAAGLWIVFVLRRRAMGQLKRTLSSAAGGRGGP